MPGVLIRVAEAFEALAPYISDDLCRQPLPAQIALVEAAGARSDFLDRDREALRFRCRSARDSLSDRRLKSLGPEPD